MSVAPLGQRSKQNQPPENFRRRFGVSPVVFQRAEPLGWGFTLNHCLTEMPADTIGGFVNGSAGASPSQILMQSG